jgi:hypothetical protein
MSTTVIVENLNTNNRVFLLFSDKEIKIAEKFWDTQDSTLLELKPNKLFENRTKWSELDPIHYKFLIISIMNILFSKNSSPKVLNDSNPVVQRLNFLICCFLKCLEIKCQSTIDLLKIKRYDDKNVSFEYQASIFLSAQDSKKTDLKVIVDNTK